MPRPNLGEGVKENFESSIYDVRHRIPSSRIHFPEEMIDTIIATGFTKPVGPVLSLTEPESVHIVQT